MHSAVAIDHTSKRVQIMRGKRIWSNNEAAMEEEDEEEKNPDWTKGSANCGTFTS